MGLDPRLVCNACGKNVAFAAIFYFVLWSSLAATCNEHIGSQVHCPNFVHICFKCFPLHFVVHIFVACSSRENLFVAELDLLTFDFFI